MVRLSITVPMAAVLVCNCGTVEATDTVSDTTPICITMSTRVCELTRSSTSFTAEVLNWLDVAVTE